MPIMGERDEVAFIFGISRDITALKKSQAQAEQAAQDAERANKVKTAFLANMSHEMRTPLNGIQASADLLSEIMGSGEHREVCDIIGRSTEALTRLTGDILEFAKIDAGQLRLEDHEFSLREVCNDIQQLMVPAAQEKNIAFTIDIEDNVSDTLFGDAGRLRQVLLNLAGNAIKFTDIGSVTLAIGVTEHDAEQVKLRFDVIDTGLGIRPDDIEKLFRPFSQVDDSTTRHHGGSGLGLAISKYLVEKMGGQIGVSSMPAEGSRFTCRIPFVYRDQPSRSETAVPVDAADIDLSDVSVLLVEDNVTNQMVMEKILKLEGMQVTLAFNGNQALELYQRDHYDLILMDWHMPLMDGVEATRRIRALPGRKGEVPVIGLTASVMAEDQETCLAAGMHAVVSKPVDRRHLCEQIVAQLSRQGPDRGR